ncbi:MAG: hypothetical protein ACI3ZL_04720 [Candidatus Cryptobacteroides sp.]
MNYQITSEQTFTLAEFVRIMDENHPRLQPALNEVAATLPEDATITSICYDYSSTDLGHQPVTMSSLMLVMRENGRLNARHLWLENRATQSSDNNVPTRKWNIGEVHVLRHGVLVSPDLMGFGSSIDRPLCYICGKLAARSSVDAVIAAQMILSEHYHLTDSPLPVLNSGHSQGGFDALAVHRYMETSATEEERRMFPLERTWCADGPYAPDVLNDVVSGWDRYMYGAYSVMNVMSHLNYHPECLEQDICIEDFLTEDGLATGIVEAIASRQVGNKDIVKIVVEALGTRTSRLFKPEAYMPDGNLFAFVSRCSKAERQIDGWFPTLPLSFFHVHADECIPVELMLEVKRLWGHLPNVTFEDDMTPADEIPNHMVHAYSGGVFHRRLLKA